MVDEDIRAFYTRPWVMVGSDGGIANRHPRGAGTFPRVLGRYVREQRWITLPEAIRKMTSAPAARLRLEGRGLIQPGAVADIVLFNPNTIVDRSTFTDPAALPRAMEKVYVGGELVWDASTSLGAGSGKPTAARPGKRADVGPYAVRQPTPARIVSCPVGVNCRRGCNSAKCPA